MIFAGILLFTIIMYGLLSMLKQSRDEIRALDKVMTLEIMRLENREVKISTEEWEMININLKLLHELALEAKASAANAHERIEYYRDVMEVVSHTSPSSKRVRLPVLPGGDPKAQP